MTGLRERRKAQTRVEIQQQAMRLFAEHGYGATTVKQIARAAEVSPSTFFRYFPTKEDVVLLNDYDTRVAAAFLEQPTSMPPVQAVRNAFRTVYATMTLQELRQEQERHRLIQSVPELRMGMLDSLTEGINIMAQAVADRVGRKPNDFAVRTFAGAVAGVSLSSMLAATEDPEADFVSLYEKALTLLGDGLPL